MVVGAVGNCVFSQSHDKILVPESRQLEVKEEKQSQAKCPGFLWPEDQLGKAWLLGCPSLTWNSESGLTLHFHPKLKNQEAGSDDQTKSNQGGYHRQPESWHRTSRLGQPLISLFQGACKSSLGAGFLRAVYNPTAPDLTLQTLDTRVGQHLLW